MSSATAPQDSTRVLRARGAAGSSAALVVMAALFGTTSGCGFADPAPIVPSYTCSHSSQCASVGCIEGVCASDSVEPYSLVLRIVRPSTAAISGPRSHTFDPFVLDASAERDLVFPATHSLYGRIALGDSTIPSYVSFTRRLAVAGSFVDDVRVFVAGNNGSAAEYRVDLAQGGSYIAVATPSTASTPALPGIPTALVGRPLTEVFPPVVTMIDAPVSTTTSASRLDFTHSLDLFTPCDQTSSPSCTARGRIVSDDGSGTPVPEAYLSVTLVSSDTEQEISTTATTAADGTFEIRISDASPPHHLRIGPTDRRGAVPTIDLSESAYDPRVGGDVVVAHTKPVHYVASVEFSGSLVPGALVRAIARTVRDSDGADVFGASFESVVRTTAAAPPIPPGFFAFDLPEGDYDLVVSDALTDTSVARFDLTVSLPPGGGALQGQVFALGPVQSLGGTIAGPDRSRLAYAQVQAIPYVPNSHRYTAEAFARPATAASDEAGNFDLSVDPGFYDFVVSIPAAAGLSTAVVPGLAIRADRAPPWFEMNIPFAAVLYGSVVDSAGVPIPAARVEAYVYLPETADTLERTVALGYAIADANGDYRLLVPSELVSPP